jgi:hypothetical protein
MNLAILFFCCMTVPPHKLEHRFYDRPAKIELAAAVTLSAFDSAQSCYNVTHKGHENFLPTQSCAGITTMLTAEVAGQEVLAYMFHRTHHHKLERMVRFISISANLDGIIYSKRKGAF